MIWLLRKLKLLKAAVCAKDSPRQMAAGLACGLLLGLIPKGNLLAILVATMLLATRMSLATGMLAALCVSLVAPWCDGVTHSIGYWVLTFPPLTALWRSISRLPLAGWTSFNNTVVMGSFLLGTLLMYPTYRLSLPWMVWLQQRRKQDQPPSIDIEAEAIELQVLPISTALNAMQQASPAAPSPPYITARRVHPAEPSLDPLRRDQQRRDQRPKARGLDDRRRSCA